MSSKAMNDEEPPLIESTTNPSLPDDLLLSCLARISRLYYPTLSLVSKSIRSLLASPELYKTRSLLERSTESCLYVCLRFYPDHNPCWFTLCRKPNQTVTNDTMKKKKSSAFVLAPIPSPHSPPSNMSSFVAVGSDIYEIGGLINGVASSRVLILNCRSNTWCEAPSMRVARSYPSATVFDGKIYVAGGLRNAISSNWMEVFDPETQTWEHVWSCGPERCGLRVFKSTTIEEKVYMFGASEGLAYKPKEGRWETVGHEMDHYWDYFSYCAVENVLYSYYNREFKWYDTKEGLWRKLKGLEIVSAKITSSIYVDLANYGRKMVVFWYNYKNSRKIWCAVITLERRNTKEIWGEVEWCDAVLTVPTSFQFVYALAPTC